MKNKNNNLNEFERLGGQKSGGGDISPPIPPPPGSATGVGYAPSVNNFYARKMNDLVANKVNVIIVLRQL